MDHLALQLYPDSQQISLKFQSIHQSQIYSIIPKDPVFLFPLVLLHRNDKKVHFKTSLDNVVIEKISHLGKEMPLVSSTPIPAAGHGHRRAKSVNW